MKASLILLLLLSTGLVGVRAQEGKGGPVIELGVEYKPEPYRIQMMCEEDYLYAVNITNLGLTLMEGNVVDPARPQFKFSGDLFLELYIDLRKEGEHVLAGETIPYNYSLGKWNTTADVPLPEIGRSNLRWYSYTCDFRYDGETLSVDEWLTLNLEVNVCLEEYRLSEGMRKYYIGERIGEFYARFYMLDDGKIAFVGEALESMGRDINDAKQEVAYLRDRVDFPMFLDFSGYDALYSSMMGHIDDGDYVSAMGVYFSYTPTWREEVIEALIRNSESIQACEDLLEDYSKRFYDLTDDYQALQDSVENATSTHSAEIAELESRLSGAQSSIRLYVYALAALILIVAIMFMRTLSR